MAVIDYKQVRLIGKQRTNEEDFLFKISLAVIDYKQVKLIGKQKTNEEDFLFKISLYIKSVRVIFRYILASLLLRT